MRIGTFMCWLFGHSFLMTSIFKDEKGDTIGVKHSQNPFCIRCGIDKPNNKQSRLKNASNANLRDRSMERTNTSHMLPIAP